MPLEPTVDEMPGLVGGARDEELPREEENSGGGSGGGEGLELDPLLLALLKKIPTSGRLARSSASSPVPHVCHERFRKFTMTKIRQLK